MLIRRHVLEQMSDPWFEMGKMGKDLSNEDTHFCLKVQQLGYKIYADTDVQLGHWTPMSLWPARTATGEWTVGVDMGQGVRIQLPPRSLVTMVQTTKEESKESFEESLTKGVSPHA